MPIKVKEQFKKTVVGFNNSGKPLGERNDLHVLLNDVIGEGDQIRNEHIADMFEELPTKAELKQLADDALSKKAAQVKAATPAPAAPAVKA